MLFRSARGEPVSELVKSELISSDVANPDTIAPGMASGPRVAAEDRERTGEEIGDASRESGDTWAEKK